MRGVSLRFRREATTNPNSHHAVDKAGQKQYVPLHGSSRASICKGIALSVFLTRDMITPLPRKRTITTGAIYSSVNCTTMRHPGDRLSFSTVRHRLEVEPIYLKENDHKHSLQRSMFEVHATRSTAFQIAPKPNFRRSYDQGLQVPPLSSEPPLLQAPPNTHGYSIVYHE